MYTARRNPTKVVVGRILCVHEVLQPYYMYRVETVILSEVNLTTLLFSFVHAFVLIVGPEPGLTGYYGEMYRVFNNLHN